MKIKFFVITILYVLCFSVGIASTPIFRVFEKEVINKNEYANKFIDVSLEVQYQSPSGIIFNFYGFFDGDGKGNSEGNIWKMRFMPNEIGEWKYIYNWSDDTKGGNGTFECVAEDGGKGILQPYSKNPHWFAYNGKEPVWLKSYYETGHGSIAQDFNWITENVYSPLIDAGYNHLQVNWLLSLCCFKQYYNDGPEPETLDLTLYEEGEVYTTQNLDVWKRMEQHLGWLNTKDVGVHMFLGVDGSKNEGPDWGELTYEEKEWFVKYMVARLAPYANLAGWNFVWEIPGDREDRELGFARFVAKYDIFNHLRSYEDEFPREHEFARNEYNFAIVENHYIASPNRDMDRLLWKEPWTHHMACLLGYHGKPVFMSEGNALWRRFWQERTNATQDDLRRSAWGCATAGASFTWCGHASEYELFASGPEGLPFNEENPYSKSEEYISILTDVMMNDVEFYSMKPNDILLKDHSALEVYALAEPGKQYLVFSAEGNSFSIKLEKGKYENIFWVDAKTGNKKSLNKLNVEDEAQMPFTPPNRESDWVLVIKR